eukprot:9236515-Alexandrium_andersonii.AAC.2
MSFGCSLLGCISHASSLTQSKAWRLWREGALIWLSTGLPTQRGGSLIGYRFGHLVQLEWCYCGHFKGK